MLAEMESEWASSPGKDFRQRLQMFVEERMQTTMVLTLVALCTCGPIFYVLNVEYDKYLNKSDNIRIFSQF